MILYEINLKSSDTLNLMVANEIKRERKIVQFFSNKLIISNKFGGSAVSIDNIHSLYITKTRCSNKKICIKLPIHIS